MSKDKRSRLLGGVMMVVGLVLAAACWVGAAKIAAAQGAPASQVATLATNPQPALQGAVSAAQKHAWPELVIWGIVLAVWALRHPIASRYGWAWLKTPAFAWGATGLLTIADGLLNIIASKGWTPDILYGVLPTLVIAYVAQHPVIGTAPPPPPAAVDAAQSGR